MHAQQAWLLEGKVLLCTRLPGCRGQGCTAACMPTIKLPPSNCLRRLPAAPNLHPQHLQQSARVPDFLSLLPSPAPNCESLLHFRRPAPVASAAASQATTRVYQMSYPRKANRTRGAFFNLAVPLPPVAPTSSLGSEEQSRPWRRWTRPPCPSPGLPALALLPPSRARRVGSLSSCCGELFPSA